MSEAPLEMLENELKQAMRAGDRERLQTLRMLLNDVKNKQIEIGRPVDESELHRLVQRAIKQRQDSARQYHDGGRDELADRELREVAILEDFLPEQAGEDELRAAATAIVEAGGLSGPAAMGGAMKEMMARFAGRADGGTINRVVREVLAGRSG